MALLRTASVVTRAFARLVEPSGLSWPQYNALRIVRGAGSGGIATLAIRERMIDEGTTITRLLDKLEAAGLIRRERSRPGPAPGAVLRHRRGPSAAGRPRPQGGRAGRGR